MNRSERAEVVICAKGVRTGWLVMAKGRVMQQMSMRFGICLKDMISQIDARSPAALQYGR